MSEQILKTLDEQKTAVIELAQNASQRLLIFSHELEPEYYNQPAFIEACKQMVIRHQQCHIRILVQNNETLRNQEHRLLALMQRLPSRIEIKLCHEDDKHQPETFMLADNRGIFLKRVPGRNKAAVVNSDALRKNDEYSRLFQQAWDQGEIDSTLRRLSL